MPAYETTVTRRQLGRWLRELRDAAGKTQADVEEANLASRVKLWRIEGGMLPVKVGDVRGLCWLYEASAEMTDALSSLAVATTGDGWWEDFEIMPTRNGLYLALEAMAESIAVYDAERVPGLLQTPDYARALYPDADDAAGRHRLERAEPLRVTAVLGEGALDRQVGGSVTMFGQIRHLQELAQERPHIDVRFLPWRVGAHPAMHGGAFSILDFADAKDPAVVHFEGHTGARYLERERELAAHRRIFADIYRQAVPIGEYAGTQQRA